MLSAAKHLDAQLNSVQQDNPVILSAAKDQRSEASRRPARPFAALRVTPGGGSTRDTAVMLSVAKHLDAQPNSCSKEQDHSG
jgi:hypothetical protein